MENKKREKFDPCKDAGRDAITMGGRLPSLGSGPLAPVIRAVPTWRQGIWLILILMNSKPEYVVKYMGIVDGNVGCLSRKM